MKSDCALRSIFFFWLRRIVFTRGGYFFKSVSLSDAVALVVFGIMNLVLLTAARRSIMFSALQA